MFEQLWSCPLIIIRRTRSLEVASGSQDKLVADIFIHKLSNSFKSYLLSNYYVRNCARNQEYNNK